VRILDGRWSGEYPLMDANPRGGLRPQAISCLTLSWW
jgi:hypothetical protein